ncbi:MAG: DUF998 domain-containing protein [Actinobacteria bacterium]|nr:DUF998 domain-containing protein [Actinomycetota bacterium]
MSAALYAALLAPIATIGSWFVSPLMWSDFNSIRQTISALAARGSPSRYVETTAFVVSGLCYIVVAVSITDLGALGRLALAVGGIALLGVAAAPLSSPEGNSVAHSRVAGVYFLAMALWPVAGLVTTAGAPYLLTPLGATLSSVFLLFLLGVFVVNLRRQSGFVGLTERIVAGAMSIWPLVLVLSIA